MQSSDVLVSHSHSAGYSVYDGCMVYRSRSAGVRKMSSVYHKNVAEGSIDETAIVFEL